MIARALADLPGDEARCALVLAAALTVALVFSVWLYAAYGVGTNANLFLALPLPAALLVRWRRCRDSLLALTPAARVTLILAGVALASLQVAHVGSWRMHRDDAACAAAALIALSVGSAAPILAALRLYAVPFFAAFALTYFGPRDLAFFEFGRFGGPFNPTSTAMQAVFVLIAFLWWERGLPAVRFAVVLAAGVVLAICEARTAACLGVGVLLVWLLLAVRTGDRGRALLPIAAATLILAVAAAFVDWRDWVLRGEPVAELLRLSGRDMIWREYLDAIRLEPWLGLGDDGMQRVVVSGGGAVSEAFHAHNAWLHWLSTRGAVATLFLSALAGLGCVGARRHGRAPAALLACALLAAVLDPGLVSAGHTLGAVFWLVVVASLPRRPLSRT